MKLWRFHVALCKTVVDNYREPVMDQRPFRALKMMSANNFPWLQWTASASSPQWASFLVRRELTHLYQSLCIAVRKQNTWEKKLTGSKDFLWLMVSVFLIQGWPAALLWAHGKAGHHDTEPTVSEAAHLVAFGKQWDKEKESRGKIYLPQAPHLQLSSSNDQIDLHCKRISFSPMWMDFWGVRQEGRSPERRLPW